MTRNWIKWAIAIGAIVVAHNPQSIRAATDVQGPHAEGPFTGGTTGSFVLPQFDTLGGTRSLTKVTVEVILDSFGGKREFDNQSPTGGPIVLSMGSFVRVKGPIPGIGSQLSVLPEAVTTKSTSVTATTGDLPADFAGTDYDFVDGPAGGISDLKSAFRTSAGDLAPYIGGSTVTFTWDLAGNSTAGEDVSVTGGGTFRTTSTTYSFLTTVYYDYVPEPAGLTFFLPLVLILRRHHNRGRRQESKKTGLLSV